MGSNHSHAYAYPSSISTKGKGMPMIAAVTIPGMGAAKDAPAGKSFSDEENERIRAGARTLLERHGTKTKLAQELGVSQPTISTFLRAVAPDGAGVQLAQAIAGALGVTLDELRSGRKRSVSGTFPRFGDLPGWTEAEAEARRQFGRRLPAYAWEVARNTMGAQAPAKIDALTVFGFASSLWEMMSDEVRAEAIRRQAEEEMAREDTKVDALLKDRDRARSRGEPQPPLPDDPASASSSARRAERATGTKKAK